MTTLETFLPLAFILPAILPPFPGWRRNRGKAVVLERAGKAPQEACRRPTGALQGWNG